MAATDELEQRERTPILQWFIWALLLAGVAYGIYRALQLAWVGDDAFISFRYAKNLVEGHGLIFNIGERVEGYTNFLWTVLIAAGLWLKLDPVRLSVVLGIASYVVTIGVFTLLSGRIWREEARPGRLIIPFTAMGLLVLHDVHIYATSGLETSMLTALVGIGFLFLVLSEEPRACGWAGLFLIAAALTRPDAMIFYLAAIPFILLAGPGIGRRLLWYLAPLVLIYVPYWLVRYWYYGYFFPNTYYAKSGGLPYYRQGLEYVWLYFKTYYALALAVPGAIVLAVRLLIQRSRSQIFDSLALRAALLALLIAIPYVFYVIRVGGDFMFARFLIPVTPLLLLIIELTLLSLLRYTRLALVAALAIVAGLFFRWNQFNPPDASISGIVDEHAYYPMERVEKAREMGGRLKEYFRNIDCTVGFYGMYAMYMYYADFPVAIECNTGLTDEHIAHQPLRQRGRVGHEKGATPEYMVSRNIRFLFEEYIPRSTIYDKLRVLRIDDLNAYVYTYDNSVMEKLQGLDGVSFTHFPTFLDDYLANKSEIPLARARQDFEFFREYYFMHNDDPERLEQFEQWLNPQPEG